MLNTSLTMSVTYYRFHFLNCLWAADSSFTISGSLSSEKPYKCDALQPVWLIFLPKTTLGILNISLSISIVHPSIDISKFNVCHFHCIFKKMFKQKKHLLMLGFEPTSEWTEQLLCYHMARYTVLLIRTKL